MLSFSYPILYLLPISLLAALFTWWIYRNNQPQPKGVLRYLLPFLRWISLSLILFLLFEPLLRYFSKEGKTPLIAVLFDDSNSGTLGKGNNRVEFVRQQLNLGESGAKTKVFKFSGDIQPMDMLKPLGMKGQRTDIGQALQYVRETLSEQRLGGVILVSDGLFNSGEHPLNFAERFPAPIHTLVVGDTTARRDVQIKRATTNEIGYLNAELPVQISVGANGYAGQSATISLSANGATVASKTIKLPDSGGEELVDLRFRPTRSGINQLTASVTRMGGEFTYANNSALMTVEVKDKKHKILLIGGAPNPDIAAIRNLLAADKNLTYDVRVQKSATTFYEGAFPTDLKSYDLLLLVGFPTAAAPESILNQIEQAAKNGKPVFVIMGRKTDVGRLANRLGAVLPVSPQVVRNSFVESGFVQSPAAQNHPTFELRDTEPNDQAKLPPVAYNQSRWTVQPNAKVLATAKLQNVITQDPLLVLQTRGRIRSGIFLAADVSRWTNVSANYTFAKTFWSALFGNLVHWTAMQEEDKRMRVRPTRQLYGAGEQVQLVGEVYDENLNPVANAEIKVQLEGSGKNYALQLSPEGNGQYSVNVGTLSAGTYRFTASGTYTGGDLGKDAGSFSVGDIALEMRETAADVNLMKGVAARSGGLSDWGENAASFVQKLKAEKKLEPFYLNKEEETPLWNKWGFLAAILSLLSLEWFLRKRNGMV